MAKTLRDYSTPAIANVPVGPAVNVGNKNFKLRTGLITMVQANQFHGLPSEDGTHISNTSLNCVTQSPSRTSHRRVSGFSCFLSPFQGRRNSGSTKKRKLSNHGTNVPQRSSLNSSPWAKPMP
jgi:hypothetical protein